MAALPPLPRVTVEEYLNTSYEPDVEYVDGILVKRNVGDWLHSLVQSNLLFALRKKYPHLKVVAEFAFAGHGDAVSAPGYIRPAFSSFHPVFS